MIGHQIKNTSEHHCPNKKEVCQSVRLSVCPSVSDSVCQPFRPTVLSGVFSPLTSAVACEKSSRWLWKEKLC